MTWVYENEDDSSNMMRHPFVESLPETEEWTNAFVPYLDDLESGNVEASLICYICGYDKARHIE